MKAAEPRAQRLRNRFRRLAGQLARTDWILLGTIHERKIPAPAVGGRRRKAYGPYYQWTFKRGGRTVTVNLSPSQVPAFAKAIHQQRRSEKLLEAMRDISRQFLDATTDGVPKRKPRLPKELTR